MSILQTVHHGKQNIPPRIFLYGDEGIGKSSCSADAHNPIFIDIEDGLAGINCSAFPVAKNFEDVKQMLSALINDKHDYHSVVVDSADWLEKLIWDHLCKQYGVSSIERVDGGFGKGYVHALTFWRQIISDLNVLRVKKNMCIILLAHSRVERFEDPVHGAYDRYSPKLHKHANAILTEWCDCVLFATRKIITKTEDAGFNRTRTTAAGLGKDGGERILRCIGSPSCVAKNRYSLPAELPLSWDAIMQAMSGVSDDGI